MTEINAILPFFLALVASAMRRERRFVSLSERPPCV
jgi:hypothetical protein